MIKQLTKYEKNMILNYAEHDGEVILTKDEVHALFDELLNANREADLNADSARLFGEKINECKEWKSRFAISYENNVRYIKVIEKFKNALLEIGAKCDPPARKIANDVLWEVKFPVVHKENS